MAILFVFINILSNNLNKSVTLIIYCVNSNFLISTCNILTSFGLRWWQHIIVRGLQEHCTVARVTGCKKKILLSRIQLCPSDLIIPFRLYRKRFPIKIAFVMKIKQAQGQRLKCVEMYPRSLSFAHGQLYVAISLSSSFDSVVFFTITEDYRQRKEKDRFIIPNILY